MKKTIKFIAIAVAILAAIVIYDLYIHNFHVVIPKQVYRSRQLSQAQFTQVIQQYHLKSIINLRGAHPTLHWYQQEMHAVKKAHIKHYDIALNSKTLPSPSQLKRLVKLLASAPRPLLIHCESGVDRSGLAAVIILILNNAPMDTIKSQVSLRYFVLSNKSVGKQLLRQYEAWLKEHGLKTNRINFYKWLKGYKVQKKKGI